MKSFLDRSLLVEGESGINLCRDLSWNDLEDFRTELDQQTVKGSIDLLVNVVSLRLAVGDSSIDEFGIFRLL